MITIYLVIIVVSIIKYIVEAVHDFQLEKLYTKSTQTETVKNWHLYDFIFHVIGVALLAYVMERAININMGLLVINVAIIRMFILNTTLNILNKRETLWYLGSTSKIDKFLKPYAKYVWFGGIFAIIVFGIYFCNLYN